ncbi:MAG TPA: hypothetical protein DIT64_07920 [Verrucomicrobiales bacterium]|mgnify:CR=1 FL=1|nr:hypothetical protein [Verrucomicrobiales bacterium]HCN78194.1 hypothetical protein [Verrucomicrobiales bacterium]HRJ09189.1 RDD family protein [Prosthecobacter sp.]HRK15806.1 RDD family protein [Prosthecobacter sp.]
MPQYHIARDGQQIGVHSEQDVLSGLASGSFRESDLCWTEGMNGWEKLGQRLPAIGAVTVTDNPYAPPAAVHLKAGPPAEYKLASLGLRFGAAMLDTLISMVLLGVPYLFLIVQAGGFEEQSPDLQFTPGVIAAITALVVFGLGLLGVNIYLLATRGQSLGKMWLGIRIVTHPDAEPPGFVKAFLLRAFVNGLIGGVPCLGAIYSLVDICFIFGEERRCIHDLIAGTQVIEGQPPKK